MSKEGAFQLIEVSRGKGSSILDEAEGVIGFEPRDANLQVKEVPVAQFANKLFMMHGNLRVLEQKMLTHERLVLKRQFELVDQICRVKREILALAQPVDTTVEMAERARLLVCELEWQNLVNGQPSLSEKYRGGSVAYGTDVSEPVEAFFHRLCVLRDGLMVTEALLEDNFGADRSEVQNYLAYVRRCYGTLKTFNILFASRDDYFTT